MVVDPTTAFRPFSTPSERYVTHERDELARFGPASAELLEERALLKRVDTKFVLRREDVTEVLASLRDQFRVVTSGDERSAHYETLYFDTPDLRFYHDHRRGRRPRSKVRIRHYVERDVCFLEVKTKDRYDVTRKLRLEREPRSFALSDSDRALLADHLQTDAPLEAQCWIEFPRVTLVGVSTPERITLDLGVVMRDDLHEAQFCGAAIVEVKQPRFNARSNAMRALRSCGSRTRNLSKYCVATALFSGERKTNRFLPAIRLLTRLSE
jgi:hypothetical protein